MLKQSSFTKGNCQTVLKLVNLLEKNCVTNNLSYEYVLSTNKPGYGRSLRLFHDLTGMSVRKYIIRRRLTNICSKLSLSELQAMKKTASYSGISEFRNQVTEQLGSQLENRQEQIRAADLIYNYFIAIKSKPSLFVIEVVCNTLALSCTKEEITDIHSKLKNTVQEVSCSSPTVLIDKNGCILHDFDKGSILHAGMMIDLKYSLCVSREPLEKNKDSDYGLHFAKHVKDQTYKRNIGILYAGLANGNQFNRVFPMLNITVNYPDGGWAFRAATSYTISNGIGQVTFDGGYLVYENGQLLLDLERVTTRS